MTDAANAGRTQPWAADAYQSGFDFVSTYGRDVVALLNPQPGERILDLGCGTGKLTAEIAKSGATVSGIDSDANMVASAKRDHPDLHFNQANGHNFRLLTPVDAVFSNAALHWMTRPEEVVSCVAAALKSGGRFVAEMGGHGNTRTLTDALVDAMQEEGVARDQLQWPWYFPTPEAYGDILQRYGLTYVDVTHFERPTTLNDGADGLRLWLKMFAVSIFAAIPDDRIDPVIDRVEQATRAALFHDGVWTVDYVRLRFHAVRIPSSAV